MPDPKGSGNYLPGVALSEIVAPAQMVGFGDCYDTPRLTCTFTFLLCTWGGTNNGSLRHSGGHFNFAFVDGHAKQIYMKAGWMAHAEAGRFARPRD